MVDPTPVKIGRNECIRGAPTRTHNDVLSSSETRPLNPMPRTRGTASVTCKTVATSSLPDPARAGVASELRIAERLQRHCCVIGKRILFPPAPSERGAWFPPGAALPHLVPMDPWKRVCSRTHELQATCRKLCRAASHGPMFARRRGLVIAPGLLHMAGMAKQAPLPKQRHYRNPAWGYLYPPPPMAI